jgi:SAM-dependent methyltransferase
MHRSSFERMQAFRDAYLAEVEGAPLKVLDVGSASIEGGVTYRDLFGAWDYLGLDADRAPNVDLTVKDPYHWSELAEASFDVVVSGQAFEHIEWPWLTIMEIARVLKPAGLAAITAPSGGHVHRYPTDCWRYYPDGLPALARYAGLSVIENDVDFGYAFGDSAVWGDAFIVLQKPLQSDEEAREWARRRAAALLAAGRAGAADADRPHAAAVAPFPPALASRDALKRRMEQERQATGGFSWRWRLVRQHLRAASRALRYPMERLTRF